MAISGQQVASSSTLETLRTQFNNLVTDVAAIEGGSISYTTLNTTTTNATTLNVKEDGTIVFEGATDDGFETTLTVVDPTADRTVTFPNASGTVIVSDSSTNVTTLPDDLLIKDGGTQMLPSYTRVDAALYYMLSDDFRLQLNMENLTDKLYFPHSHSTHQVSVGRERNVRLSLTRSF